MNIIIQNIKIRFLIIILCITSLILALAPSFSADTFNNANKASEYVSIRLNELRMLYSNATKEQGNLPKLIKIYTEYIIVLDFVENTVTDNPNSGYDFVLSQTTYNEHVNYASVMAKEINTLYNGAAYDGEEGANPLPTSIEDKTVEFWLNNVTVGSFTLPTASATSDRYRDEVTHIYNDYLLMMLKVTVANSLNLSSIDDIDESLTEEEINKVLNTNKSIVSALASMYYAIQTDIAYWNSITITGFKNNKFGELGTTNPSWVSTLVDTALNSGTTDSNSPGEIVIKDANSILALLTNATMENGSLVFDDDTANLTDLGYILVSAGVVYDPFVSTAGNDLYLETIKEFISDEEQWDKATMIIKKAISMKKPLYISEARETSSTGKTNDAATYRKAFLADALNTIELTDNKVYQFSVVKGQMTSSKVDSSTFEYVQNFGGGGTTTELTDLAGNPINNSDNQSEDIQSGNATANGEYTTVGSNSLVASNTEMTDPVMYISSMGSSFLSIQKNESSVIGSTTSVLLHNAMKDAKNNDTLANSEMSMLFINGMGDIVLADDTIILPAIANPVLYPYENLFIDVEALDPSILGTRNGAEYKYTEELDYGYYPYTAAFMNHIPEVTLAGEKQDKLAFANDKDKDKFAIFTNSYLDNEITAPFKNYIMASKIESSDSSSANIAASSDAIMPININTFSVGEEGVEYNNSSAFRIFELGQKLTLKNMVSVAHNSQNLYFYKEELYNGSKVPFFPIVESDNIYTLQTATAPLTTSARRYIATSQDGSSEWVPTGAYNIEYLIKNMISEALLGTQYADSIDKNSINSYEDIVQDSPRRFEVFIVGIAENILSVLGRIDGVLAMHTGYENSVFAKIVRFIDTYYVFILIILSIIVAVKFLKNKLTMIHVFVLSAIMIASFDIYTTWLPVYIPETYNFFVNDVVEDISWKSVYNAAENYSETYLSPNRVSSNGEEKPYTATITLYQLTEGDIKIASDRLGISETQIKTGDVIYLDQAAGIFLEGNRIKMSLDVALSNKTIRGLYKSQWEELALDQNITLEPIEVADINENPYQIRYINNIESLDSYYTPYNEFIGSFIDNLNIMSSIFNIQRNTFSYDKDFSKDAFMVNSFIHSGLFLNPGNWETLKRNIAEDSVIGGDYSIDNIRDLVESKFKHPSDWLGMANWILEPTDEMKETLWARTLQANGYYENNWKPTDKMNDLISYVNIHTKNFIVNNVEQINYCSDENAIKLISLFATTALCDRASQYTSWMYPNYLNSADMEMEDVLYAAMTTLQDQNVTVEDSLIGTINYIYGTLGVILLILILIFSNIFIFVLTYFIPILYLLLGLMLIFKLIVNRNASTAIKGYAKITCTTLVLYFIYNCTLTVASSLGHHWFAIILVALFSFLCCWFLAFTIMSVFTNITDLGNATLKANLLRATNTITSGAANKFYANLKNMFTRTKNYYTPKTVYQYARSKSIDDLQISHGERTIHNTEINKTYSPYRRKHIEE